MRRSAGRVSQFKTLFCEERHEVICIESGYLADLHHTFAAQHQGIRECTKQNTSITQESRQSSDTLGTIFDGFLPELVVFHNYAWYG